MEEHRWDTAVLLEEELNGRFTLTHPAGRGTIATAVIPPVERAG